MSTRKLSLSFFLLMAASTAHAQTSQISGVISDVSHAAIPQASITVENTATHGLQKVTSNSEGFYLLPALQPGTYDLTIAASGFESKVLKNIRLEVAGRVSIDQLLTAGSVTETVTVDGSGLAVNTIDASVSTVVDQQFVSNIPLNGRTLQTLVTAIPGTLAVPATTAGSGYSGEFSVNGSRSESNYFTVDGVSANTGQTATVQIGYGSGYPGAVSQLTALGTTHSLATLDSLQEFRGITSTYAAEYGRSAGGQFALLTRSGTNLFHGTVFEYFRNAVFDANAYFNKFYANNRFDRPKENQNDFGGTLGGPIFRERTFFFVSYEGLRLRVPKAATLNLVPDMASRGLASGTQAVAGMQPFLRAFPQPSASQSTVRSNGLAEYYASYSIPSNIDAASVRIDHALGSRNRLFGRWSYTPSETTPRYTSNLAIEAPNRITVKTVTAGLDTTVTNHQVNSLRANYTWNDNISTYRSTNYGGATALPMSNITGLDDTSQVNLYLLQETPYPLIILKNQASRQTQINITDAYSIALGRHSLKFGVDWRRLHNSMTLPGVWEITNFRTATEMWTGKPASGQARRFYGKMEPVYNNWSLYAQDEWSVSQRLNLSYGLRWELNPAPVDATGNNPYTITGTNPNTAALAPKSTSLYKTVYTNFAPRLGVAYTLHPADGHQAVLRAGWGFYYEMGNAIASNGYLGVGIGAIGVFNGLSYPFTQSQLDGIGQATVTAPYSATVFAFDPNLKTPRVQQYSAAVEQQFGRHQTLTLGYVGARGSKGLTSLQYYPSRAGNTNFSASWPLILTTNAGSSNYNSLQAKFQKTLSHNLQALVSYTWAHSMDNATSNYTLYSIIRSNSDYDVRHNFQATFTYNLPGRFSHRAIETALGGWAVDGRISARSGLPVDVIQASSFDPATGQQLYLHPNRLATQPLYVYGSQYAGGRAINRAAFSASTVEGTAGRNVARGFNAVQGDLTVHKTFAVYDRMNLQFRAEAFNIVNKANIGAIYNTWTATSTTFGQAYNTLNDQLGGLSGIYQQGGPRSLQLAIKLQF